MSLKVKIDVRERQIIDNLQVVDGIDVETVALDVGDIQVCFGEQTIVFERKTIADLCQSIKDGRYREQKARLLSTHAAGTVYYIIEGNWSYSQKTPQCGLNSEAIHGCLIKMLLRDKIGVFHTKNIADTVCLLEGIFHRMKQDPESYFSPGSMPKTFEQDVLVGNLKARKKDNLDAKKVLMLQLSCIPGISIKTAGLICNEYECTTMQDLVEALKTRDLKELPGIGKGLSKVIRQHVLGEN